MSRRDHEVKLGSQNQAIRCATCSRPTPQRKLTALKTGNICERCINRIPTWKLKKLKASSSRVSG
jgi:DNA-directed RNA polymerase subunit RPC12/RpoP